LAVQANASTPRLDCVASGINGFSGVRSTEKLAAVPEFRRIVRWLRLRFQLGEKRAAILMGGGASVSLGYYPPFPPQKKSVMPLQNRIESLDQFRGYTVGGMFLVNYLSGFWAAPFILHHHNTYCSYADTIMPGFFFAVGFSMRLSFGRRQLHEGLGKAYWHMVKRLLGLVLVSVFITYQASPNLHGEPFKWDTIKHMSLWALLHDPLKNTWFQTLTHIAVTSLWILPVLRLAPVWRVLYMILSAAIHVALSGAFYFDWVNGFLNGAVASPQGIDGGPLGFLTWTIPTMIGTLACDAVMTPRSRNAVLVRLFGWGVVLMALGWFASCGTRFYDVPADEVSLNKYSKLAKDPVIPSPEQVAQWQAKVNEHRWSEVLAEPPFVPPPHSQEIEGARKNDDGVVETVDRNDHYRKWNYWMMSQRAGTISYLTFGAGFSLALYGLFYVMADKIGLKIGVFRTFGTNALFGYVLHDFVGEAIKKFVPPDVPASVMWISCAVFFFFTWLFIRSLEKRNIFIKL
jgi:predicted acyltransferase